MAAGDTFPNDRPSTLLDEEGARYTIDLGLICTGTDGRAATVGDGVFLETKAPGAATAGSAVVVAGHRPMAVSKYCSGLAA